MLKKVLKMSKTLPLEYIIDYDNVTNPKHYNSHPSGIECIDIAAHHNFNIGNAIKYLWRAGLKNNNSNEQDIRKAMQYLQFELNLITHGTPNNPPESNLNAN
jgi:Protein of unknwon function (DUF3310)